MDHDVEIIASLLFCFLTILQLIQINYTTLDTLFIARYDVSVMQFPRPVVSEKGKQFSGLTV